MTKLKPLVMRYKHDCSECKVLGQYLGWDLYFCDAGVTTVIARWGDAGEEFTSGIFKDAPEELKVAAFMARSAGYLQGQ